VKKAEERMKISEVLEHEVLKKGMEKISREEMIKDLKKEIKKKDEEIKKIKEEKEREIKKQDEENKKMEDEIKKKDEEIKKRDEEVKRRDEEIKKKYLRCIVIYHKYMNFYYSNKQSHPRFIM
jgi:uncharacterized protein (DUF3084 family)